MSVSKTTRGMKAGLVLHGKAKDVFALLQRMAHQTTIRVVCAWCGKDMGEKDGKGQSGISHGLCEACAAQMGFPPPQ